MESQFISHEQALELKGLGFKEECLGVYTGDVALRYEVLNQTRFTNDKSTWIAAPLWQQAFDFFRIQYGYCVEFDWHWSDRKTRLIKWDFIIAHTLDRYLLEGENTYGAPVNNSPDFFLTYEEARSAALDYLIKLSQSTDKLNAENS